MAVAGSRSPLVVVAFAYLTHAILTFGVAAFVSEFAHPEHARVFLRWESFGLRLLFESGEGLAFVRSMGRTASELFLFVVTGVPWVVLLFVASRGGGARNRRY